jgi:hypothetical protein
MQSFIVLKQVVRIVTSPYLTGNTLRLCYKAKPVKCYLGKQSLFIVRTIQNTDTLCGQNAEF